MAWRAWSASWRRRNETSALNNSTRRNLVSRKNSRNNPATPSSDVLRASSQTVAPTSTPPSTRLKAASARYSGGNRRVRWASRSRSTSTAITIMVIAYTSWNCSGRAVKEAIRNCNPAMPASMTPRVRHGMGRPR